MDLNYEREILAFEEKVSLAKLEEAKASERVKELEYQKARFRLDYFIQSSREPVQTQPTQPQQGK